MRYNPRRGPDPEEWLAADEVERLGAVLAYHRRIRAKMPSLNAHAAIHVTVENQVALGDETPVAETLQRLMREGLDRHEAVHAIGSVLAGHIWHLLQPGQDETVDPNVVYYEEVRALTAQRWRDEYGVDD